MKKLLLLFSFLCTFAAVNAQTARVQIIHNSADDAAAEVDVYLNDGLAVDNFAFRTSTGFIDLPADTQISIDIAPGNSTSSAQSIYNLTTTLTSNETYVIVANGIVNAAPFSPAPAFDLDIFVQGRESATVGTNTDILVNHGSTDAPVVDIVEVGAGAGTVVDNLDYRGFAGYLELPTADYAIEVRDETGTVTVAAYELPLAALGLDGAAVTAVASGFLDPAANNNGEPFGIYVALPSGGPMVALPISTARVQVIHNSADAAASEVDVYLNGALAIDDFAFRTATPYLDFPSSVGIEVAIAPASSTGVGQAIATFPFTLARNETYQIVADGIVSGSGYNPAQPFTLEVLAGAREVAADPAQVDVMIHHGATDAPTVDIFETNIGIGLIANNLSYSDFRPSYLNLPAINYAIEVRDETGTVTVASYELPLGNLGIDGAAVTAVASGFLDPSANSNGEAFGIFVALPSGGPLVGLETSTARMQVIHNSADAAASEVDVYIDGALALDNFAFRTATPFIDITAEIPVEVAIAPATSTGVGDAIATFPFTLEREATYIVVADGIVSPSGYNPSPAFNLEVYPFGQEAATDPSNTDVLVHHGSTDAPVVDIVEVGAGAGTIVDNIAYTEFSDYLNLPTANYAIEVRDETGAVTVAAYEAPLADLGLNGVALVAVASGFLDPSVNSNGAEFGVFAALPAGGPLVALENSTARVQVIHNSPDALAEEVDVYINGGLAVDNFAFRSATGFIDLPAALTTEIAVAPANSTSVNDAIATFPFVLEREATYVVVADGVIDTSAYNPAPPFGLEVYDMGREAATLNVNTDVLVHHGSTDAPTVDVVETGLNAGTIVDDLAYTDFQGYLELATLDYVLEIRDETGTVTVASYDAPLSTLSLEGQAIVVVASGFLDPSVNSNGPAFGLWVALSSGGDLIPLPETILSVTDFNANDVIVYPNPTRSELNIAGINGTYSAQLVDLQGRVVMNLAEITNNTTIDLSAVAAGMYQLVISNGIEILGTQKVIKD